MKVFVALNVAFHFFPFKDVARTETITPTSFTFIKSLVTSFNLLDYRFRDATAFRTTF